MATSSQLDPVQGLIDYVLEIKPYHTKIVEVLIEHIHNDCVDVTIAEDLSFCINVGIPNLNSKFKFVITEIDVGTKTFKVDGDARFSLIPGQRIQVIKSEDNNGFYTVQEVTYDYGIDVSSIIMTTAPVSSSIVGTGHDGYSYIVDNTIIFCPDGLDYPFVKQLSPSYCEGEGFGASYYDGVVFEIIAYTSSTVSVNGDMVDEFDSITDVQIVDSVGTIIGSFAVLSVTLNGLQTDVEVAPSVPALSGTNYLFVRNIPYDTSAYTCGAPANANIIVAQASFTETIEFGWYGVADFFQSPIIAVNGGTDTFTVSGNLTSILQIGQQFEISGSPSGLNDGTWTVSNIIFNGTNTEITVTTSVGTTDAGGYARSITNPLDSFQTPIVYVDGGTDTFYVDGDITPLLVVGDQFTVTGSPDGLNDGTWTVDAITFNSTQTEITVTTTVGTTEIGGYVRSTASPLEVIALYDSIGTTVGEDAQGAVASDGPLIGSWDYGFWDIGGYDEDLGTLISLYSS